MENQMTVDEQLDRMNEAEFKAFLEACTNKSQITLEQAAMFSQLDRPTKAPEEQIPSLTNTKYSSSLQSLNQSHHHSSGSRKNSQIHNSSKAGSSSTSGSWVNTVGSTGYSINNNTHHHHHPNHISSSFSSNNNHNLVNANCISTSSTSPLEDHVLDPGSHHSQNQQTVNCVTMVPQNNNSHHLHTPSSYYSSPSSSPSHTEEETATTSANSSSNSPNNSTSYSSTFTATAPPSGRQYRCHSQSLQNPPTTIPSISTTTSSSISVNFNLKRPPPKPLVQNHAEVTATAKLPSPYFFNCRTQDNEAEANSHCPREGEVHENPPQSDYYLLDASRSPGNIQLRNEYPSVQSLTGSSTGEYGIGSLKPRISPRSSRSGTPVQGETVSASLNVRRLGGHGGARNKKPKETILSEIKYVSAKYENLDDLVSYITGEPEKAQGVKKAKKKGKRKETLSKSHSLDENTLGSDVNPSIETRSVSSILLENKSDEKPTIGNTTEGLDLSSSPSSSKLDSSPRTNASAEFITVIRKKNKGLKSSEISKPKQDLVQNQEFSTRQDFTKSMELGQRQDIAVLKEDSVPKSEPVHKLETVPKEAVTKKESVTKSDQVLKQEVVSGRPDSASHSNQREMTYRQESGRRQEPPRKYQEGVRKYPETMRKSESFRKQQDMFRRQDQFRRRDSAPREDIQIQEPNQRRHQYGRQDSEYKQAQIPSPDSVSSNEPLSKDPVPNQSVTSPVSTQDPVKFCGVNFHNKPDMTMKPNVEFGFGVTDVLSQLAIAVPSEIPVETSVNIKEPELNISQHEGIMESPTSPSVEEMHPTTDPDPIRNVEALQLPHLKRPSSVGDKESLLGRHPQSVLSPPVHYIPMSMGLSMSGTGYPIPAATYYQPLQHQLPVGVMQYFPGPHLQQIQQNSAPIMTSMPSGGSGNIQQQFINHMALTPQQHQLIQQQLLQQQQQQQQQQPTYSSVQPQPIHQYQQVLLKPTTPQQYSGNQQQNMASFPVQNPGHSHSQQGYSQVAAGGNVNYSFHRASNITRSNHTMMTGQLTNYGLPPAQSQAQYGPNPSQFLGQNSSHQHNYSPSAGVHYNYLRNSGRSNQNNPPSHNYGQQPPPTQVNHGSALGSAQALQYLTPNSPQNMRSLGNPVVSPTATINPPVAETSNSPDPDGFIDVNSESNPVGQYYTPPPENEDESKYAHAGQEYMNKYVEKLNERISKGAIVHRVSN